MIKKLCLSVVLYLLMVGMAFAGAILNNPMFSASDDNGDPLIGGLLYSYIEGTTTAKVLYTDKACTVADTNPVVLDSRGEAEIYGTAGGYKLVLKTAADVTIWTLDEIEITSVNDAYYYFPDSSQADQGAATGGGSSTVKDFVDSIGTSKKATIVYVHTGAANTTPYVFSTTETITSNISNDFQNGAQLVDDANNADLIINGAVIAALGQQIFSWDTGSGEVTGLKEAYSEMWGDNATPGTTDMAPFFQLAANSLTGGGKVKTVPGSTYNLNTMIIVPSTLPGIHFDFTGANITNTVLISSIVINSSTVTAPLVMRASNCSVKGGYWYDMAGQALRAYGVKGSDTYSGAGFIENIEFTDMVLDNVADNAVIINSFHNGLLHNIVVRDKGDGNDGDHSKEIGYQYGTNAIIGDSKVIDNDEGGGFYGLFVQNLTLSNCQARGITNSVETDSGNRIAYYFRSCLEVLVADCTAYLSDSGSAIKFSYDCEDVSVTGGYYEVLGADTADSIAGIHLQGVNGVLVEGVTIYSRTVPCIKMDKHTTPTPDENTTNVIITGNRLHNTYVAADPGALAGSAVYYNADSAITRGPVKISGNYIYRGSILAQGAKDFQVSDNYIYTDIADPLSDTSIFINVSTNGSVSNNLVTIDEDSTNARYGVQTKNCTTVRVTNNDVRFHSGEKAGSVAYRNDTTTTTTDVLYKDNIHRYAATPYRTDGAGVGIVGTYTDIITLTAAQVNGSRASPVELVATQGADTWIEFIGAMISYDYIGAAFTVGADEDFIIRYDGGAGTDLTVSIESVGFIDQTNEEGRYFPAVGWTVTDDVLTVQEDKIEFFNTGSGETADGGTSTLIINITYRIHATGL